MAAGIASKKSDMTANSYASTRRASQWSVRATAMYARFRQIVRTREIRYMSMPRIGVEMRRASSATIESSPNAEQARGELLSRAPLQIFAAIFVVAALVYSFPLGADALAASEAYSAR